MRQFALAYRMALGNRPFVGITGSCAKSTTTRMTNLVLRALGKGQASGLGGNSGQHIIRSVFRTRLSDRYSVQEISGHQPGALDIPLRYFRPNIGVVTWIGNDHWKAFGDPALIAEEKVKMVSQLPEHGTAILNADDPVVAAMAARTRARVVTYGLGEEADVRGTDLVSAFPERLSMTVRHGGESARLRTAMVGEHMAYPLLAAIAVGRSCGLSLEACVEQLEGAEPHHHRLSVHRTPAGTTFILDTRKAPLWTVEASLRVLETANARRKTIVIGALSDYSGSASRHYRAVARRALEVADRVYFVGPTALRARKTARQAAGREFAVFPTVRGLHDHLEGRLGADDLVLIKAGGGDHVERLFEARAAPFACWQNQCGIDHSCSRCTYREVPSSATYDEEDEALARRFNAIAEEARSATPVAADG